MAASLITQLFSRHSLVRTAIVLSLGATTTMCAGCPKQESKPAAQQTPETKKPETQPVKPLETKPAETKPQETKPEVKPEVKPETKPETKLAEQKPDDAKPAVDPWPAPANKTLPTMNVTLDGKTFKLEKAMDGKTRFGGLSGRKEIAEDGGMIFVFRSPAVQQFVMRDCPADIDIIYVDATGRIVAMYHMKAEAPRAEDEKIKPGENFNQKYEERLKKYSSKFAACIVIELKANTINIDGDNPNGIKLKVGDKLDLDVTKLRQEAQP